MFSAAGKAWAIAGFSLLVCLAMILPAAHAASTTITNLSSPSHSSQQAATQGVIVTYTITYSGLSKGESLASAIITPDSSNAVLGAGMSTPDPCVTTGQNASCLAKPQSSSGKESMTFDIILPSMQQYNLEAVAGLVDSGGHLIGDTVSSSNFNVTVDDKVLLTISVPDQVTFSVDGSANSGTKTVPLQLGTHEISLPETVQLTEGTRLRFLRWMDGSTQPTRTEDVEYDLTYAATYTTQYDLNLVDPSGTATGGWYDEGATAQLSVPSKAPVPGLLGALGGVLVFRGFDENGTSVTSSTSISIAMDSPRTLYVEWTPDYTTPELVLAVAFVAIVVTAFVIHRRVRSGGEKAV